MFNDINFFRHVQGAGVTCLDSTKGRLKYHNNRTRVNTLQRPTTLVLRGCTDTLLGSKCNWHKEIPGTPHPVSDAFVRHFLLGGSEDLPTGAVGFIDNLAFGWGEDNEYDQSLTP